MAELRQLQRAFQIVRPRSCDRWAPMRSLFVVFESHHDICLAEIRVPASFKAQEARDTGYVL